MCSFTSGRREPSLGDRRVLISFSFPVHISLRALIEPRGFNDDGAYDDSAFSSDDTVSSWGRRQRFRQLWSKIGICPNAMGVHGW